LLVIWECLGLISLHSPTLVGCAWGLRHSPSLHLLLWPNLGHVPKIRYRGGKLEGELVSSMMLTTFEG
jgi:hypothetical protein